MEDKVCRQQHKRLSVYKVLTKNALKQEIDSHDVYFMIVQRRRKGVKHIHGRKARDCLTVLVDMQYLKKSSLVTTPSPSLSIMVNTLSTWGISWAAGESWLIRQQMDSDTCTQLN